MQSVINMCYVHVNFLIFSLQAKLKAKFSGPSSSPVPAPPRSHEAPPPVAKVKIESKTVLNEVKQEVKKEEESANDEHIPVVKVRRGGGGGIERERERGRQRERGRERERETHKWKACAQHFGVHACV